MYRIYVNDILVKEYPYELQATIYCFINGYITTGRGWYFLNPHVEIIRSKDEQTDN